MSMFLSALFLKACTVVVVAVVAVFFAVQVIYAITNPDALLVPSAQCYGGLVEVGDIGCITHYDIDYASIPTELASEAFLNGFVSSSTTAVLRSSTPYVFVNSGYGNGAINIYFSAAEVDVNSAITTSITPRYRLS